ncbi:MAG: hypothetical protein QXT63_08510 [Thermoplasmata archaeon]
MHETQMAIDTLASYIENSFNKFKFPRLGEKEKDEIMNAYNKGIFDEYFSLKEKLPKPTENVSAICYKIIDEIFSIKLEETIPVGLYANGKKIEPNRKNAVAYIVNLFLQSIFYLDDIYLNEEYSSLVDAIQKQGKEFPEMPERRSAFFVWLLFLLMEFMKPLATHERRLLFYKHSDYYSEHYGSYTNEYPSVFYSLFTVSSEIAEMNKAEILEEIVKDKLKDDYYAYFAIISIVSPDTFKPDPKADIEEPFSYFMHNPYFSFEYKMDSIKRCMPLTGADEKIVLSKIRDWIEQNPEDFLLHKDISKDPSCILRWKDWLGENLTSKILNYASELKTPLHKRSIQKVGYDEKIKEKYGNYRLYVYKEEDEFGGSIWRSVQYHVLQKASDNSNTKWQDMLKIEVESYESEPFEPKEYRNKWPPLIPRIYIDDEEKTLYIEQEDGTLYHMLSENKWETSSIKVKINLYIKRLKHLKYIEIPIGK